MGAVVCVVSALAKVDSRSAKNELEERYGFETPGGTTEAVAAWSRAIRDTTHARSTEAGSSITNSKYLLSNTSHRRSSTPTACCATLHLLPPPVPPLSPVPPLT
eukprot:CAMPEP_0179407784 /NCGR_PEP_ID=MMETSP0799-20121207/1715_1 /TAXON_ID=46947 /ORGANISM="Geminigera cryophila, Strain CCMP2564" /LENGTH=103 /DNA_ID=CAMNT_0021179143 /DNA_START=62 /DNA_END=369 /DNA_ORIENTATION=-